MADTMQNETTLRAAEEHLPVATFKNSLREWQARWQAQRPAAPASSAGPRKATVRPRRGRKTARPR